jgi:hypothetical protein
VLRGGVCAVHSTLHLATLLTWPAPLHPSPHLTWSVDMCISSGVRPPGARLCAFSSDTRAVGTLMALAASGSFWQAAGCERAAVLMTTSKGPCSWNSAAREVPGPPQVRST